MVVIADSLDSFVQLLNQSRLLADVFRVLLDLAGNCETFSCQIFGPQAPLSDAPDFLLQIGRVHLHFVELRRHRREIAANFRDSRYHCVCAFAFLR